MERRIQPVPRMERPGTFPFRDWPDGTPSWLTCGSSTKHEATDSCKNTVGKTHTPHRHPYEPLYGTPLPGRPRPSSPGRSPTTAGHSRMTTRTLLRLGRPHGETHQATRPQPHGFDRQRRGNGMRRDIGLWRRIHALPEIDYANIHIWPYNWRWISQEKCRGDLTAACEKTTRIHPPPCGNRTGAGQTARHRGVSATRATARLRARPRLRTATRRPTTGHIFRAGPTHCSGRRHRAGCNFWGWGGAARPDTSAGKPATITSLRPGTGRAWALIRSTTTTILTLRAKSRRQSHACGPSMHKRLRRHPVTEPRGPALAPAGNIRPEPLLFERRTSPLRLAELCLPGPLLRREHAVGLSAVLVQRPLGEIELGRA